MDEKKILILIRRISEKNYEACRKSIDDLRVPDGYALEVFETKDTLGDAGLAWNFILRDCPAKYKILVSDDMCFINERALLEMLEIFNADEKIGVIGICGAIKPPQSGVLSQSESYYGGFYRLQGGEAVEETGKSFENTYKEVQLLDSEVIMTQYDISCDEETIFETIGQALSLKCREEGYKAVVAKQDTPWCLNTLQEDRPLGEVWENLYDSYKDIFKLGETAVKLNRFGKNIAIGDEAEFSGEKKISLGEKITIGKETIIRAEEGTISVGNRVKIGKRCYIEAKKNITIESDVVIEDNVKITDTLGSAYLGKSFDDEEEKELFIGHCASIGKNAVIKGKVRICYGARIEENSYVDFDVPDYTQVAGNPAKIVRVMNIETGEWEKVKDEVHLNELLNKRKNAKPLLTIGIPTYNRSKYLRKCMKAIYDQIGDDPLFEVFVSDNDSTDDTTKVVQFYKHFVNLNYVRQEKNIGAEENIAFVYDNAKGKFVIACGDDDYYIEGALLRLVTTIYYNLDAGVGAISWSGEKTGHASGYGLDNFVLFCARTYTSISSIVLNKKAYDDIVDKKCYSHTSLNQVYLQMEIVSKGPKFFIFYGKNFTKDSGENAFEKKHSRDQQVATFCKIFIGEYLDMLYDYLDKGLSKEALKTEKINLLKKYIFPWLKLIVNSGDYIQWRVDDNIEEIMEKYYGDEPYYDEVKKAILPYMGC